MSIKSKSAWLRLLPRHAAFLIFIFIATFPMLNIMPVAYFFFVVYYILLYVLSERAGGMTPVLRVLEAGLTLYLFAMNSLSFLAGVYFTPSLFYLTTLLIVLWLLLMGLRKLPIPRFLFLSLLFPFFCYAFIPENVLQKRALYDCDKIKNNKNVSVILPLCDTEWVYDLKHLLPKEAYALLLNNVNFTRLSFVTGDPRYVYLSFGRPHYRKPAKPEYALLKVDRERKKIISAMPSSTFIHMAYDKKRGVLYATAIDENAIVVIDEKTFTVRRKIPVAVHPIYVHVDEKENTLIAVCDFGVHLYDLDTFKEKKSFIPRMAPGDSAVSFRLKKIFMCGYATSLPFRAISFSDGAMVKRRLGWIPPFSLFCSASSLDEQKGILFISMPLQSRMYLYRAEPVSLITWFHVPKGIRRMAYSPEKQRLYAGNYITGNLEVINPFKNKVEKQIFVGKRIRDVYFSPATRKVYVASSLGFLEVTP